jgi:hypothetical protein
LIQHTINWGGCNYIFYHSHSKSFRQPTGGRKSGANLDVSVKTVPA